MREYLHARGHPRTRYARTDMLIRQIWQPLPYHLCRFYDRGGIVYLMPARHGGGIYFAPVLELAAVLTHGYLPYLCGIGDDEPRAAALRCLPYHIRRLCGIRCIQHRRTAGLDYARLLTGYLFHRVSEYARVVKGYGHYHRAYPRGDYIGGVEQSAHPRFKHHRIAFLLRIPYERYCIGDLELRVALIPRHILHDAGEYPLYFLIGDVFSVYADAVVVSDYIRRGELACPVSRTGEHLGEHAHCRALAVCPRHMDKDKPVLGIAERVHKTGKSAKVFHRLPRTGKAV